MKWTHAVAFVAAGWLLATATETRFPGNSAWGQDSAAPVKPAQPKPGPASQEDDPSSYAKGRKVFVEPLAVYGGTAAGLAVDSQDNLYIAVNRASGGEFKTEGPHVLKVAPDGKKAVVVPPGKLGGVTALAFDAKGNLYIADGFGNGRVNTVPRNKVWVVKPDETLAAFVENVKNPTGLAFDSKGNLYVSSFADNAVLKYSPTGQPAGKAAGDFDAKPYGIAIDKNDNLYVAAFARGDDAFGQKVYKIPPGGKASVWTDPGFADPHSLAFDPAGNLWASYYNGKKLVRIAPDGSAKTFPGGWAAADNPNGIAFDSKGNLYVAINQGVTLKVPAVIKISAASIAQTSGQSVGKKDGKREQGGITFTLEGGQRWMDKK